MVEVVAEPTFDRLPPHDIETEQCALGAAMLAADAAGQVAERLRRQDFFRPAHQAIFAAVVSLYERGEPVNAVTVRVEMGNLRADKEHVPDGTYLHTLIERVPAVRSVGFYIAELQAVTDLRGLALAGPSITQLAYGTPPGEAQQAVERANRLLDEATRTAHTATAKSVAELITGFMDMLESGGDKRGVTTGLLDLDALLLRMRPGQFITVGARPGLGKTALMAGLAYHAGVELGLPVYVATLEMSTQEYIARLVSMDARVNLRAMVDPSLLTEDDWSRLADAHTRLSNANMLVIDDEPGMGIAHIRASLRAMRRAGTPPALVIIDYLQLMESGAKFENRQVEVSQFSRSLKLLAKEFDVPIVVGSQLNRDVEKRHDKRPSSADLRESGSLEQDSDVVILLYRDDAYDRESPRAGEIDLIVDKNRSGPKATVTAAFQGHYSRVVDMARPDWTPSGVLSR